MKDVSLDLKQFQMEDGSVNDGLLTRYWRKTLYVKPF
jgi:hypothetical protein